MSHRAYFTDDAHLGTCFRDAVIGTHREGTKDSEVSDFILKGLIASKQAAAGGKGGGGGMDACPSDADRTVLILQRRTRRLLNAEALAEGVRAKGLFARILEFDDLDVPDQIKAVRCCKLFVAVMGAGQQWVSFMRRGSALLSIGWRNWKADYYKKYVRNSNGSSGISSTSSSFQDSAGLRVSCTLLLCAARPPKEAGGGEGRSHCP